MSAAAEANKPATADSGAESPTTARPLEMDDDESQETGVVSGVGGEDRAAATSTARPTALPAGSALPVSPSDASPYSPVIAGSETEHNIMTLKEAFPTVDDAVVRAVLRASGGRVEPSFHALLEMTDPEAAKNEPQDVSPPPQPPRSQGRADMSQVEADELYARQLAEHYENDGAYEARTSSRSRAPAQPQGWNEEEREHSFLDDDLPIIRENLRKGFLDTQTKVNGWITTLKKRIDETFEESEEAAPGPPRRQGEASREASRRSGDYHRYDADPQVLSDDFAGMRFSTDGTPANPGLHKPPPRRSSSPRPGDGRRVGFKNETEEINMYDASPTMGSKDTASSAAGAKASKWQPLSKVEPKPIADNDPFSLGDSEDEKDAKDKPKEAKGDDGEKLKTAAAEAMADSLVDEAKGGPGGPGGEPADKKA